ncbi:MAG: hypothetical protein OYL92_03860 [Acidobacteriota bacterium]|nr:hypothetical protein [Acidobacteriota bacterium]MDE3264086.1 hypothetical protein [Acidobacteriota bacterium]
MARHLVAGLLERGDHADAVVDETGGDALAEVAVDGVAVGGVGRETARPGSAGAVRVVRPRPAVFVVQRPLQQAVRPLPAGRGDVVALARQKLYAGDQDMHVGSAVIVAVEHRRPGVAIRFEAGPGDALEVVERLVDLVVGRVILGRPGDHGAAVAVLEVQGVGDMCDLVRIAAQHRDLGPRLAGVVAVGEEVVRRGRRAALAVLGERDQHGPSSPRGGRSGSRVSVSSRTSRSSATRWAITWAASAAPR